MQAWLCQPDGFCGWMAFKHDPLLPHAYFTSGNPSPCEWWSLPLPHAAEFFWYLHLHLEDLFFTTTPFQHLVLFPIHGLIFLQCFSTLSAKPLRCDHKAQWAAWSIEHPLPQVDGCQCYSDAWGKSRNLIKVLILWLVYISKFANLYGIHTW